ncbi:MAG: hypothetical protein V4671_17595, partial [Armatimonadota bacterium]
MRKHAHVLFAARAASLLCAGALSAGPLSVSVLAQTPQEAAAAPAVAAPTATAPKNLFEALPNLRWDPAERGPLLIVVPQAATPTKPLPVKGAPPVTLQPPVLQAGEYRTSDLLDYYGRRMVRLRGVTVFAPAQMVVLNTNLGKPDLLYKMSIQDKIQVLQSTLTPAQWRLFSSPNGIGIGDLDREQRDVFESLLPNPFVYRVQQTVSGLEEMGDVKVKREPPAKITATDAQRSGIRLKIHRETTLFLPSKDPSSPFNIGYVPKDAIGTPVLAVDETFQRDRRTAYGVLLSDTVPSYLKRGQIDFDAASLNAPVGLADAETVGDLIDRIRIATRIEIYVDLRLARLPVYIRASPGTQLRAGELLKSLCWGVTGVMRYVSGGDGNGAGGGTSGAFILTDDLEGLGTRWGRITEWSQGASDVEYAAKRRRDRVIRRQKALELIGFAPDEPFKPTPEQTQQIEKGWSNSRTRFLGVPYPLSVLPADLQERARQSAQETNAARAKAASGTEPRLVSEDTVTVSVRLGMRLEVPGVGSIPFSMYSYGGLDSFLPEPEYADPLVAGQPMAKVITLSTSLKAGGVLSITAADEEEARTAVRAARARGLRQVWIASPSEREDPSVEQPDIEFQRILSAAVAEARQPGLKPLDIVAVARVLS